MHVCYHQEKASRISIWVNISRTFRYAKGKYTSSPLLLEVLWLLSRNLSSVLPYITFLHGCLNNILASKGYRKKLETPRRALFCQSCNYLKSSPCIPIAKSVFSQVSRLPAASPTPLFIYYPSPSLEFSIRESIRTTPKASKASWAHSTPIDFVSHSINFSWSTPKIPAQSILFSAKHLLRV